jgi:hypothetical protein
MVISKFLRDFSRLFVKYIRFEKEPTIPDLSRVLYWNEEDTMGSREERTK